MDSLRYELSDIIAGDIPDTPENQEFCEKVEDGFNDMLDRVMAKIKERLNTIVDED